MQGGLVLARPHSMVGPGHVLLPLCPPAVPCHGHHPAGALPAVPLEGGALLLLLLLVVLLSVGDAADGAVGGAFVGVLGRQLLLPVASLLGQYPTEAAPHGAWGGHSDGVGDVLRRVQHTEWKPLLVCLAQRLRAPAPALGLVALQVALHHAGCFVVHP